MYVVKQFYGNFDVKCKCNLQIGKLKSIYVYSVYLCILCCNIYVVGMVGSTVCRENSKSVIKSKIDCEAIFPIDIFYCDFFS